MSDVLGHWWKLPAIQQGDMSDHDYHAGPRLQWQDGVQRVQGTVGRSQPVEGVCVCVCVCVWVCACMRKVKRSP